MRSEKTYLVNQIAAGLTDSDYVYFVSFQGLKVKDFAGLRDQLYNVNAKCSVFKKSLIRKAVEVNNVEALNDLAITGDVAMVYGKGDPGAVAKVLVEFGKSNEIGKTVRQTIAEAASKWLNVKLEKEVRQEMEGVKVVKPAAGYSSCPDHTLKKDILGILGECNETHEHSHQNHGHNCSCGCHGHNHSHGLGIKLTESYAMTPDASICGMIFMHPEAGYPEIRNISREQYESYMARRGMDADTARRFLGHLLK